MKDKTKIIFSISIAFLTLFVGIVANLISSSIFEWIRLNNQSLQLLSALVGVIATIITLFLTLRRESRHTKKDQKDSGGEHKDG